MVTSLSLISCYSHIYQIISLSVITQTMVEWSGSSQKEQSGDRINSIHRLPQNQQLPSRGWPSSPMSRNTPDTYIQMACEAIQECFIIEKAAVWTCPREALGCSPEVYIWLGLWKEVWGYLIRTSICQWIQRNTDGANSWGFCEMGSN